MLSSRGRKVEPEKCRSCGCTNLRPCGPVDYMIEPGRCAFCKAGADMGIKHMLSPEQRRAYARRLA